MEMPIDIQHQQMGYDRTATMFSPDGHLLQVEYAEKTVRLGSSSIGMKCKDGVFILADRRIRDKLIVADSANKIFEIDSHILSSVAGIMSDAKVLIDKAQVLAQQNRITYNAEIEPEIITKELAGIQQQFTHYGGARPLGVSIMIAGIKNNNPQIFTSDITGNYFEYYANAIGENDETIKKELRKNYSKDLTIKEGVKLSLDILKSVQSNSFDIEKMELCLIKTNEEKPKRLLGKNITNY